jgi:Domain of unknown function (DUF4397)
MKKALSRIPFHKIPLFVFGILTLSLTGCFDDDDNTPQLQPQASVSFYHGSPDAPDLDILINTQKINNLPFKYSHFSDYVPFNPGTFRVKFTSVNNVSAFIDTALTFQQDKAYSIFVVDSLANIEVLVLKDSLVAPAAGQSRVRFINLSPDAPAVDVATTGSSATTLFSNVAFKGSTEFKDVPAGTHSLQVKTTGGGTVLLPVPNVDLTRGQFYTFVFRGFVSPPAGASSEQSLKFQLLTPFD